MVVIHLQKKETINGTIYKSYVKVKIHITWDDPQMKCLTAQFEMTGWLSAQVSDDQEHKDAGQQHPSDHDELILGGSSFDEPHHRVRQAQHVGNIQHLLMCPLWSQTTVKPVTSSSHKCATLCSLSALIHLISGESRDPPWRATLSEVSHDGTARLWGPISCHTLIRRGLKPNQEAHLLPGNKGSPTHFEKAQEQ